MQTPACAADLAAFRAFRGSLDVSLRRGVAVCGAYREGGKTHQATVAFLPQGGDAWHVHVEVRLARRRGSARAPAAASMDEPLGQPLLPQKVDSSTLRRIVTGLGRRLAGPDTAIYAQGEFLLPLRTWRPLVDLPFELIGATEAVVGVDLVGVRLAWRDGSLSAIVETLGGEPESLRVYLRMRSKLELSGSWVRDAVGRLSDCLSGVVQSLKEGD